MRGSSFAVVMVVLGMAVFAEGGVIAPSKPSQTFLLKPGAACPAGGLVLDTRIDADGTTASFTIPDKQVLVLDAIGWFINGAVSPGNSCAMILRINAQIVWSDTVLSDSFGSCGQSASLPNILVRSGNTVCVGVGSGGAVNPAVTRVHGFLAKDK